MTNVRKMALVDPRLLETLRNPMQPPVDTTLRDLDADMTNILDRTDIEVSDKYDCTIRHCCVTTV